MLLSVRQKTVSPRNVEKCRLHKVEDALWACNLANWANSDAVDWLHILTKQAPPIH